jgi:hypothetical protein
MIQTIEYSGVGITLGSAGGRACMHSHSATGKAAIG